MALFFHTDGSITRAEWHSPPASPCYFIVLFTKPIDKSRCSAEFYFNKMADCLTLVNGDLTRIVTINTGFKQPQWLTRQSQQIN